MEFHIYLLFLRRAEVRSLLSSGAVNCGVVRCAVDCGLCTVHCGLCTVDSILQVGRRQTDDQLAVLTPAPIVSAGLLRHRAQPQSDMLR